MAAEPGDRFFGRHRSDLKGTFHPIATEYVSTILPKQSDGACWVEGMKKDVESALSNGLYSGFHTYLVGKHRKQFQ